MAGIARVVPVLPVPLVAMVLSRGAGSEAEVVAGAGALVAELQAVGAVLKLAPQGLDLTVREGLAQLQRRGLIGRDLGVTAGSQPVLDFYAAGVAQRLAAT